MNLEELREYCLSLSHVTEDMPFGEDILVFRICNRIFALTSLESVPLRVSLKCDPERAIELREQYPDKIVAGYHLNKKHWNTVSLTKAKRNPVSQCGTGFLFALVKGIPARA